MWFAASQTLFAAATAALDAAHATDGIFDPTLLAHMRAFGYDRDYAELSQEAPADEPARPAIAPADADDAITPIIPLPTGGWRAVELDPAGRRIRLPGGVGLDLGGIAKGWAADCAVERFFADFPGVIVNLGGDLRLRGGPQPGELWAVGVRDPLKSSANGLEMLRATITLSEGGVATSGATDRWWRQGAIVRHHLIDPRTGAPADLWLADDANNAVTRIATATALAPTAAAAEVAAKVALLAPPQQSRRGEIALRADRIAQRHNRPEQSPPLHLQDGEGGGGWGNAATLLIMGDGTMVLSENFTDYLAQHGGGRLWRLS